MRGSLVDVIARHLAEDDTAVTVDVELDCRIADEIALMDDDLEYWAEAARAVS